MESTQALPRWQLGSIYPTGDSDTYDEARSAFRNDLAEFERFLDDHLDSGADLEADLEALEGSLARYNALLDLYGTLATFLTGSVATDAFDDHAAAEQASLRAEASRLPPALARLRSWLAERDRDTLLIGSAVVGDHRYFIERSAVAANYLLPADAEAVAAALQPTGSGAWSRLHGTLIGRHSTAFERPGGPPRQLGVAQLRNLQADPDYQVRTRAFRAELQLLARNEDTFAAAMNAIKGEVATLAERRGWASPLEMSLFDNAMSPASLDAMQLACREVFPDLRRYLRAKAAFLGQERLSWHDLLAPVSTGSERRFEWQEAAHFVREHFRRYWPPLAELADRAFSEGWIDVGARPGKRNGAFCAGVPLRRESRILLNFGGTLDDVFTLAHELGHAYHNDRRYRSGRTAIQGSTPMTLAETASIFCETVVVNAMLAGAAANDRLAILEQELLGATQLVLDIHSRFLFERTVFELRRERELSSRELRTIMLDAQTATYGDALTDDGRHPLMWAHKGHYYSGGRSFYNYPYTFGYLFGLGLYAEYRRQPDGFEARYDALLADTGLADAATLASRFGIDIEDIDFWRRSLAPLRQRAAEYEALVRSVREEGSA